ncbi:MAG: hypothetical protein AMXMBFR64_12760 [Myxococcales bacterium]
MLSNRDPLLVQERRVLAALRALHLSLPDASNSDVLLRAAESACGEGLRAAGCWPAGEAAWLILAEEGRPGDELLGALASTGAEPAALAAYFTRFPGGGQGAPFRRRRIDTLTQILLVLHPSGEALAKAPDATLGAWIQAHVEGLVACVRCRRAQRAGQGSRAYPLAAAGGRREESVRVALRGDPGRTTTLRLVDDGGYLRIYVGDGDTSLEDGEYIITIVKQGEGPTEVVARQPDATWGGINGGRLGPRSLDALDAVALASREDTK